MRHQSDNNFVSHIHSQYEFCRLNFGVLYIEGSVTSSQHNKACGHTDVYTFCTIVRGFAGFTDYYIRFVTITKS